MKKLFFIFTLLLSCKTLFIKWTIPVLGMVTCTNALSQNYSVQGNTTDNSWSLFETNSPTSGYGNRRNVIQMNTNWHYHMNIRKLYLDTIMKGNHDMLNAKVLWLDSTTGEVHVSSLSKLPGGSSAGGNVYTAGYGITKYGLEPTASFSINPTQITTTSMTNDSMMFVRAMMATMDAQKLNDNDTLGLRHDLDNKLYSSQYTYSLLPGHPTDLNEFTNGPGYISSYTETDPTVPGNVKSISAGDIASWNAKLSSYTETDPVWSASPSSNITSTNIANWNSSFGWGNHASQGYITPTSTATLTNKSGNISMWANNIGYISVESDPMFNTYFASKSTGDLPEGSNLYYTESRARSAFSSSTGINISGGVITNTIPDKTITLTGMGGINVSGTYPNFSISIASPTINNSPGRSLNNNFTPHATKYTMATYAFSCSVTNPLISGSSQATVFPEYSTNTVTPSWIPLPQTGNSSGVGVTVAVAITNSQTIPVSFMIPPGVLVRFRTSLSGTSTAVISTQQETYLPFE